MALIPGGAVDDRSCVRGSRLSTSQEDRFASRVLPNSSPGPPSDDARGALAGEQDAIRKHFAGCTVLTIAKRLETIMDSDRVLVMKDGKVRGDRERMTREHRTVREGRVSVIRYAEVFVRVCLEH